MACFIHKTAYQDYLETNEWQLKRLLAFKKFGRFCQICGSNENLEVHHLRYSNHITTNDLRPICRECHKNITLITKSHDVDSWATGKSLIEKLNNPNTLLRQQQLNKHLQESLEYLHSNLNKPGDFTVTKKFIMLGRGWSAKQLEILGEPWPPTKGWIKRAQTKTITKTDAELFLKIPFAKASML